MNSEVGDVVVEIAKNKRKWEDFAKSMRKQDRRQEVVEAYAVKLEEIEMH